MAKVPVAILKDLILRLQQVGPRASLAEPLDWENAEVDRFDMSLSYKSTKCLQQYLVNQRTTAGNSIH